MDKCSPTWPDDCAYHRRVATPGSLEVRLLELVEQCWAHDAKQRPCFDFRRVAAARRSSTAAKSVIDMLNELYEVVATTDGGGDGGGGGGGGFTVGAPSNVT
eukprot:SAG11_NODE_13391_length_657_cov_1.564516_1_plen_102_part_00